MRYAIHGRTDGSSQVAPARSRALPRAEVETLLTRKDLQLRERMLYETGGAGRRGRRPRRGRRARD